MKPAQALAKYGSDKVYMPCHHYGDFYNEMFGALTEPLNILEIGVLRGQSLMAWREAFPTAKVTGIDIEGELASDSFGIKFIKDDVKNITLDEQYDVIIDDSSHDLQESTYVIKNFCQNLTEQGVMVIEDIQEPERYVKEMLKVLPQGFKLESHDFREFTKGQKHDDFIVKITRR